MCERTRWPTGHFGLAVDKAVLDALLTSRVEHGHAWRASASDLQPARAYLAELHRLLEPGARPHHAKASIRKHMPRKPDPKPCVCVPVKFSMQKCIMRLMRDACFCLMQGAPYSHAQHGHVMHPAPFFLPCSTAGHTRDWPLCMLHPSRL